MRITIQICGGEEINTGMTRRLALIVPDGLAASLALAAEGYDWDSANRVWYRDLGTQYNAASCRVLDPASIVKNERYLLGRHGIEIVNSPDLDRFGAQRWNLTYPAKEFRAAFPLRRLIPADTDAKSKRAASRENEATRERIEQERQAARRFLIRWGVSAEDAIDDLRDTSEAAMRRAGFVPRQ